MYKKSIKQRESKQKLSKRVKQTRKTQKTYVIYKIIYFNTIFQKPILEKPKLTEV